MRILPSVLLFPFMLFSGFATFCGLHPNGDFPLHPWLELFIGSALAWVVLVRYAAKNR